MASVRRPHGNGADLRLLALAFLAGVLAVSRAPHLPSPWWLALPALAAVPRWRGRWPCLFLALGLASAWGHAGYLLRDRLPAAADGHTFQVTGYVASLPQTRPGRRLFVLRRTDSGQRLPSHLRLSWYHPDTVPLRAGQCWHLRVKLHAPRGLRNPGGFDYAAWLFRNDIGATGYVRGGRRCGTDGWHPLLRLRQALATRVRRVLAGSPMAGVVLALAVGDRSLISRGQWRVLRATGTSHLVAISGLHVGIVASAAYLLVRWLWCWVPALCMALAAPRAGAIAAVAAGWCYALLAGMGLPTERAVIMLSVAMAALAAGRLTRPSSAWAAALVAVLLVHPFAVQSAGFWLSFGAVAWLLYLLGGRLQRPQGWRLWVGLQAALLLALAPLTIGWFGQLSLVGPLANSVLIPLFGLFIPALLLSLMLLPVPWLGSHGLIAAAWLLGWLYRALAWLATLPGASLHPGGGSVLAVVLALAGAAVLLMPRGLPGRWVGLALCLPLLLPARPAVAPGSARVVVLDVGQGQAVAIRTRRHTALFDTGPAWRGGFDAGRSVVVPYLRWAHVRRIDRLIVSHPDRDHSGGLGAILRRLPVGVLQDSKVDPCRAGQHWQWDGVRFRILHPADRTRWHTTNNASCVLRVACGSHAVLITADIEKPAEAALVQRLGPRLHADVLVVPHHGSDSSSSRAFVAAVHPRWALVSAGYGNEWGFPRADVVARYRAFGARVENTAQAGAIVVHLSARGVRVGQGWRRRHRRLWTPR